MTWEGRWGKGLKMTISRQHRLRIVLQQLDQDVQNKWMCWAIKRIPFDFTSWMFGSSNHISLFLSLQSGPYKEIIEMFVGSAVQR